MADQKEELVVVQEEQPKQFTFLNYLTGIKRYKWWVIGFSLGGALIGYLGFKFILNPAKKTLNATYAYELAGTYENTDTISLVDGSTFNPYELTGATYLEKVKNGEGLTAEEAEARKKEYKNININKLVEKNAITITKNVIYYNSNDIQNSSISYKISAKAASFPSDKIGQKFIYDLVNYAKVISSEAIANYESDIKITDNYAALTFQSQISQLDSQYNSVLQTYNTLITTFNESSVANAEGKKLYQLKNDFTGNYITNGIQSFTKELKDKADTHRFINYDSAKVDETINEIKDLSEQYIVSIKHNDERIAALEDQAKMLAESKTINEADSEAYKEYIALTKSIRDLKLANNDLKNELEKNGYKYNEVTKTYEYDSTDENSVLYKLADVKTSGTTTWSKECNAFKQDLLNLRSSLESDRVVVSKAYRYCYDAYQNRVNMQNGGYVTIDGGISSAIGALAGLAGGFIITTLITAAVYVYKKEK